MKPSIGRIVHYVSYGTLGGEYQSECRAAIVTEVKHLGNLTGPLVAGLCVLNPSGQFFNRGVSQHDGSSEVPVPGTAYDTVPEPLCDGKWYPGGTWHWPAEVK